VANAATIAVAATVIFPRLWVGLVGAAWVLLMAFSRTYLHAHWLSDTVGGAMIGAGAALLVAAAFALPMAREGTGLPARRP
jgi:undecaprenyl-diphosphatase